MSRSEDWFGLRGQRSAGLAGRCGAAAGRVPGAAGAPRGRGAPRRRRRAGSFSVRPVSSGAPHKPDLNVFVGSSNVCTFFSLRILRNFGKIF